MSILSVNYPGTPAVNLFGVRRIFAALFARFTSPVRMSAAAGQVEEITRIANDASALASLAVEMENSEPGLAAELRALAAHG
jgi:hypothetical protein